jgi:thymidylate synthase
LDLEVGDFVWTGGDCHIYQNHFDQVQQQLERTPRKGPTLEIPFFSNLGEIKNSKVADYKLIDYNPMDSIAAPMAV